MTAIYDQRGIRFLYPENWTLSDESEEESSLAITLQSPATGFFTLNVYSSPQQPSRLITDSLEIMRQEYPDVEAEQVSEPIDNIQAVGYNMDFYCLDLIVTAHSRSFRLGKKSYLFNYQAETEEFEQLEPVFQAMMVGFIREIESE